MSKQAQNNTQEVLFQKLGNTWYVFSLSHDDELIFTALPEGMDPNTDSYELYEVIEEHFAKTVREPEMAA